MTVDNKISFGCKVPANIESRLRKCVLNSGSVKRNEKLFSQKIENIKEWGNPNSEIVYAVSPMTGNFRLGLKINLEEGFKLSFPITGLKGKNELSQFLSITKEKIEATEKTIVLFYKKYGFSFFDGYHIYNKH